MPEEGRVDAGRRAIRCGRRAIRWRKKGASYADQLGLDVERFDEDRRSERVVERVERNIRSAIASREVLATPTLFVDAVLHNGGYDTESLMRALES